MIEYCIDQQVTTFDHADIYGHYTTEEEFGNALAKAPHLREKMQLITKCGIRLVTPNRPSFRIRSYDTSKEYILQAAERSLQNLKTDRIDLLLIHRPDPLMDPDEIAEAFHQLQQDGKVLHFGVSNFNPSQASLIRDRFPIVNNQMEISILHLDPFTNGSLHHCMQHHILPTAWGPLGSGKLFDEELADERTQRIRAVATILGDKYSLTTDQTLLAWLTTHPAGIIPVLGTSRKERILAAKNAVSVHLDREEWFMLWRASTGEEVP
jgi:predicted oxidoreductase